MLARQLHPPTHGSQRRALRTQPAELAQGVSWCPARPWSEPSPGAGSAHRRNPGVCPGRGRGGGVKQKETISKRIDHASISQTYLCIPAIPGAFEKHEFRDAFPGSSGSVGLEWGPCGLQTTDHQPASSSKFRHHKDQEKTLDDRGTNHIKPLQTRRWGSEGPKPWRP